MLGDCAAPEGGLTLSSELARSLPATERHRTFNVGIDGAAKLQNDPARNACPTPTHTRPRRQA